MKRTIVLALIAALALTVGPASAAAADPGAAASAKAGKKGKRGKGKACKGKRGKGRSRGKARRSADASAKARKGRKGKGKRRGCKGGRGAGKGLPLGNGLYKDTGKSIGLNVKGKLVQLELYGGNPSICAPLLVGLDASSVRSTASQFLAAGSNSGGSDLLTASWKITVKPALRYTLEIDSAFRAPFGTPCEKNGAVIRGQLTKDS